MIRVAGGVAVAVLLTAMLAACSTPSAEHANGVPSANAQPAVGSSPQLTKAELSGILGLEVTTASQNLLNSDGRQVVWKQTGDHAFSLSYWTWKRTRAQFDKAARSHTPIQGLGDAAYENAGGTWVLKGDTLVRIQLQMERVRYEVAIQHQRKVAGKLLEKLS